MKKIEILGMGWDAPCITFHTMDGRDGRVHYSRIADAMRHYGSSFESNLGGAFYYADAEDSKIIFDNWGGLIKRYIEDYVYPHCPEIIQEKSQD